MAHVITFRSSMFDVTKETPNPINPIAGEGVLLWLRGKLEIAQYEVTVPDSEDWGWYVYVRGAGASYMVGAGADIPEQGPVEEWTIQVHKQRSLKDRIKGVGKLAADDPLSALIESIMRAEKGIESIDVDKAG